MNWKKILLPPAILCTALIAGVFYAFVIAVNPALAAVSDKIYITTMQSINREIVNPLFAVSFFGAPTLLVAASVVYYREKTATLILAATIIYLVGSLGITLFCNIPLNDSLSVVDTESVKPEQLHDIRLAFAGPWNRWHAVRTVSGVVSLILLLLAVRPDINGKRK